MIKKHNPNKDISGSKLLTKQVDKESRDLIRAFNRLLDMMEKTGFLEQFKKKSEPEKT